MSGMSDELYCILKELFPHYRIVKEYYVKFNNQKLFFDFYIKELGVYVEVQGRQHVEYVQHFHGDRDSFIAQQKRDNMKRIFVENNPKKSLVRFYFNEVLYKYLIITKISSCIEEGFFE